ncbi:MAG TPA: hypothetical protein DCY35_08610 [Prolixibacteraceae bacterium]|nr:hypothetical protein [Prolixibacteraceae bacterium]
MENFYFFLSKKIQNQKLISNSGKIRKVNGHIHSPYSFSAFSDIREPLSMAVAEGIAVLGINDFYTTDGYRGFAELALESKVFPLFNIEFMALQKEEQKAGVRINDPQNPGRTYISGKGLAYPVSFSESAKAKMEKLMLESNRQTYQMVDKLNLHLEGTSIDLRFSAEDLHRNHARNLFRERHIATALRNAVFEEFGTSETRKAALELIIGAEVPESILNDRAILENEIRNRLLKAGGPAYIPEDESAFLSLDEVLELIIDGGGIPCYPVLLDDAKGNLTDFEADFHVMAQRLKDKGIYMIELIPGRNDFHVLKDFVTLFDQQGFTITFGTEHNTPKLDPLTVTCRGGVPLDAHLMQINYRGACIIAAHQYLVSEGKEGFPTRNFPNPDRLNELARLGERIIDNFTNS